ncbi:MAG: hypothetical protein EOR73_26525 [Mesorhizobium sp.]|nr:MAG: hypothetical protein EOR73_26525 [Mesorhizobium sp.]
MSFITFNEAVTRVRARLNVPNPDDVLWEAVRDRRIKAGFPGDRDDEDSAADAWTDHHLNTRAAHMTKADRNAHTKVDLDSLMAWLDSFFAPAKAAPQTFTTGLPGSPEKGRAEILREFERRKVSGETLPVLAAEVRAILNWYGQRYPDRSCPKPASTENLLRSLHREATKRGI